MQTGRGSFKWEDTDETYNEGQVESVVQACGIEVTSETGSHFLALCPFHGNVDSAAFAINKENGLYICFNPSCGKYGSLVNLPQQLLGMNYFESMRLILKNKNSSIPLIERLERIKKEVEFPVFSLDVIDKMHEDLWESPAHEYMKGRGFSDETLSHFKVGYSVRKNLVAVPMYKDKRNAVGVVGRTIKDKRFRNSDKLPKKELPWNFHAARYQGDSVIIVESTFDAMRIHQAGYPNVIALLGGSLSPWHVDLIGRTFTRIIIMTDFDTDLVYYPNCKRCSSFNCTGHRAGRDLGRQIVAAFPDKRIFWGAYDNQCVFPHGAKDASDMSDLEIQTCLKNAVTNFDYIQWNVENMLASAK